MLQSFYATGEQPIDQSNLTTCNGNQSELITEECLYATKPVIPRQVKSTQHAPTPLPHEWCHHAVCQDPAMHGDQKLSHFYASRGSKQLTGRLSLLKALTPLSTLLRWRSQHPAKSSSCSGTSTPKSIGESSACQSCLASVHPKNR